jgi:Sulfotransferase family
MEKDKKLLFVWVPKNGGTSVYDALRPLGMRKLKLREQYENFDNKGMVTFGHVSIPYLLNKGYVSYEFFQNAVSFAFVRNPWDRFVSLFLYFKKHRIIIPPDMTFPEFCHHVKKGPVAPVGRYNRHYLSQCNNQVDWLFNEKGVPMVGVIGRVSHMQEDFDKVTDYVGLDRTELPFSNHIKHDYIAYYTDELREIVGKIYERDIKKFNFEFDVL